MIFIIFLKLKNDKKDNFFICYNIYHYYCKIIYYIFIAFMNLSKTSQYAIRILSYMTVKKQSIYPASLLISELQISDKYLKHLMTSMAKKGLIISTRGRQGGFMLKKRPDDIFLNEIIDAVDDQEKYNGCVLGFDNCSDDNPCALHNEWLKVQKEIEFLFHKTTLKQIVANKGVFRF